MLMEDIFERSGMNRDFVIKAPDRFTNAYCKPMRKGISEIEYEDPRLDFGNYEPISKETENRVIENLRKVAENIDVLCVADQFMFGIITKRVRDEIIACKGGRHRRCGQPLQHRRIYRLHIEAQRGRMLARGL